MQANKDMLRRIIVLSIPACIEYLLQAALTYVDLIMVGGLGKNALAAIGLTSEVNFLLKGVLMAAGIGFVSYISVSIGKRDFVTVKKITVQAFYAAGIIGAVLTVVGLGISPFLPGWMGAEEMIKSDSVAYFAIVYSTAIFTSFNMIFGSVLKGAGDMKTPMYVNIIMSAVNIIVNALLIYESRYISFFGSRFHAWGAGLGVRGAACGTAIASIAGGLLMAWGVFRNPLLSPVGEKFRPDRAIIKKCFNIAMPVFLCRVTTSLGRVLFTAFIAGLGTVSLAAHTISFTAESGFYMAVVGAQAAVTTLAGNFKGERNRQKLNSLTKLSSILISGVMLVVAAVMALCSRPLLSLFTNDLAVINIGTVLLCIIAVNEPFFGIAIIMEGIFNGIGDTKSPFLVSAATLWFVRVLGTCLAIYVFGWGIYGAWVCMALENAVRAVALAVRYHLKRDRLIPYFA